MSTVNRDRKVYNRVNAGMFAALVCVATMAIKVPTPGTGGYVHLGDAFVILSGIILGPVAGGFSAAFGSALADAFSGYLIYAPATLIIKGLIGAVSGLIYKKTPFPAFVRCILCGVFAVIAVASLYLVFELFLYGRAAFASVPANLIQGASGLVISSVLRAVFEKCYRRLTA